MVNLPCITFSGALFSINQTVAFYLFCVEVFMQGADLQRVGIVAGDGMAQRK